MIFLALLLIYTNLSGAATVEVKRPEFSAADRSVIDRNSALKQIVDSDPWLVRRFLDLLAAQARAMDAPIGRNAGSLEPAAEPPSDPEHNPDLEALWRASPEASHDLFLLIKQAVSGAKKPAPAR
jgi:hypothetical protein